MGRRPDGFRPYNPERAEDEKVDPARRDRSVRDRGTARRCTVPSLRSHQPVALHHAWPRAYSRQKAAAEIRPSDRRGPPPAEDHAACVGCLGRTGHAMDCSLGEFTRTAARHPATGVKRRDQRHHIGHSQGREDFRTAGPARYSSRGVRDRGVLASLLVKRKPSESLAFHTCEQGCGEHLPRNVAYAPQRRMNSTFFLLVKGCERAGGSVVFWP